MHRKRILLILFILLLLQACKNKQNIFTSYNPQPISQRQLALIDSILQDGLDKEALYTLLSDIKPISSLTLHQVPLANSDSTKRICAKVVDSEEKRIHIQRLTEIQTAINKINLPDLRIVMVPYLAAQDSVRLMQVSAVRISLLDSLLKAKESFFAQFGLVPGTDPAVVLSTIENAGDYERLRGYGYLFGYPDYAVDFFVEASYTSLQTGKFVPRNFFQIPVYQGNDGYFVYAYPKNHKPTMETDSTLYYRSMDVLKKYRTFRNNYLNPDSTLQAYKLLRDVAR